MPDPKTSDPHQSSSPACPPFHVILSYLLGVWADLRFINPEQHAPKARENDHDRRN